MYYFVDILPNYDCQEVTIMANQSGRNKLVVPGAENAINQMKAEIANELGFILVLMRQRAKMVLLVAKLLNV